MRSACALLLLACLQGCASAPSPEDLDGWRAAHAPTAGPALAADIEEAVAAVDSLRWVDLDVARAAALALLSREPGAPAALWRAARAEVDLLHALRAREVPSRERDLAARSALDYAQRAENLLRDDAPPPLAADVQAQLAWCYGVTVHLQPMLDRDEWAARALDRAQAALALAPEHLAARAVRATVHLRLATLPFVARLFAGDAPEGDLDVAATDARACVAARPTLEHRLLLARVLAAQGEDAQALAALDASPASRGPRDPLLEADAAALRADLR